MARGAGEHQARTLLSVSWQFMRPIFVLEEFTCTYIVRTQRYCEGGQMSIGALPKIMDSETALVIAPWRVSKVGCPELSLSHGPEPRRHRSASTTWRLEPLSVIRHRHLHNSVSPKDEYHRHSHFQLQEIVLSMTKSNMTMYTRIYMYIIRKA